MEIEAASSASRGSAVLGVDGVRGEGVYLVWEDLSVVLSPKMVHVRTRKLLQGLHGYAEPGRILAVMGPSGSGKSTLLDALAGRLSRNVVMTGSVLLNGKKRTNIGRVAYVTQEDVLLKTLTVRETIAYSAQLRLPATMDKEERRRVVEGSIMELGLEDCADRLIGNWHLRGISGGERKRLSIALEILTRPWLMFLDEPTSGLDSASAFSVIQTLRSIASDGRTIMCSIHQPSSEVFALFDDLFLLSNGETVYFGDAKKAVQFFHEAGFPCPIRRNPSDHFLRCINIDFDAVTTTMKGSAILGDLTTSSDPLMNMATAEVRARLIEKYRHSSYPRSVKARIKELSSMERQEKEKPESRASWRRQISILTRRSFLNMSRDTGYYWARIVIYIVVSLCVGTIYYDVGHGYSSILARTSCGGFVTGFMTFMSIGGFPSFIEEMKVFYREKLNGYYGASVFVLSNYLSSFPFLVAIAAASGTICFHMVKFRSGFSYYLFFCLNIFGGISVIESLMMVVASVVPNFLMGLVTGAGIIGILLMTSGFFRLLPDLPKPFWRYPIWYINQGAWGIQGACKNDFLGLEFDPLVPGDPKLKGDFIITNMLGVPLHHSKWWDLSAIYLILVAYRILFFIVLKFKERASPIVRDIYSKRALQQLEKRPSFRTISSFGSMRLQSFGSKRHLPPRSLSSQEGLNSPLHY